MGNHNVIGKRLPRVEALDKVTGRAVYVADVSLPNMLYGKILWSNRAHARIRRLDVSRAAALEGVMAVVTAADVPPYGDKEYPSPMTACIAVDKVIFAGQPVAAVAATSLEIAEAAVGLIEVDYEELPAVIDVTEAMQPEAPLVHPGVITEGVTPPPEKPSNVFLYSRNLRGDIAAGFREADIILEKTYRTQTVQHGYLEPRAALASADADGKITLWADNQGIFECRDQVADFLKVPLHHVRVMPVESGGAFGGKSPQIISPICALLSIKTGRPVKIVTIREEVLQTNRPAAASAHTVKMGVTRDGHITAASIVMAYDFGALAGVGGMSLVPIGSITGFNPYRIENFSIETHSVYTNKPPSGPYRGPTAPQASFAVESHMDLLARELAMDPLEFRLKNAVAEGDLMVTGTPFGRIGFKETIARMQEYLSGRDTPPDANRGRGIACGFWGGAVGAAGAIVSVNGDGTVSLLIGSVDVSGSRTSLVQIVAEELGIPFADVAVVAGDTDTAPFSTPSVGSMITRTLAGPILLACQDVKDQACHQALTILEAEAGDVEYVEGRVRVKGNPEKSVSLQELAREISMLNKKMGVHMPTVVPIIGRGSARGSQSSQIFAVETAEVEVDRETGKVRVLSFAVVQDVGLALNPTLLEGQVQGAVAQGIGWSLFEDTVFKQGVMQNTNLLDYRMPTAVDVPSVDVMLVEVPHRGSTMGIRGAGEAPMVPVPAVIANAIHSATGKRLQELPMTPEKVFEALNRG